MVTRKQVLVGGLLAVGGIGGAVGLNAILSGDDTVIESTDAGVPVGDAGVPEVPVEDEKPTEDKKPSKGKKAKKSTLKKTDADSCFSHSTDLGQGQALYRYDRKVDGCDIGKGWGLGHIAVAFNVWDNDTQDDKYARVRSSDVVKKDGSAKRQLLRDDNNVYVKVKAKGAKPTARTSSAASSRAKYPMRDGDPLVVYDDALLDAHEAYEGGKVSGQFTLRYRVDRVGNIRDVKIIRANNDGIRGFATSFAKSLEGKVLTEVPDSMLGTAKMESGVVRHGIYTSTIGL